MANQESGRLFKSSKQQFFEAVEADDGNAITALIALDADPQQSYKNGITPAYFAAFKGKINALKAFLSCKRLDRQYNDVNQRVVYFADPRYHGRTLLYGAARGNQPATVKELLSRGANTSLANRLGETPAVIAVMEGHLEVLRVLIEVGCVSPQETRKDYLFDPFHLQSHSSEPLQQKNLRPFSALYYNLEAARSYVSPNLGGRTQNPKADYILSEHEKAICCSGLLARAQGQLVCGSVFQHEINRFSAQESLSYALLYERYSSFPTLLCLAVEHNHPAIVDYLVGKGAATGLEADYLCNNAKIEDRHRQLVLHTPIMIAVRKGDVAMCQRLGLNAINVNALYGAYLISIGSESETVVMPDNNGQVCHLPLLAFDGGQADLIAWLVNTLKVDLWKTLEQAFIRFHVAGYPVPDGLLIYLTQEKLLAQNAHLLNILLAARLLKSNIPFGNGYLGMDIPLECLLDRDAREAETFLREDKSVRYFSSEPGLKERTCAHFAEVRVHMPVRREVTKAQIRADRQHLLQQVAYLIQGTGQEKMFLICLTFNHEIVSMPDLQKRLLSLLRASDEQDGSCLSALVRGFREVLVPSYNADNYFRLIEKECSYENFHAPADFEKKKNFLRELIDAGERQLVLEPTGLSTAVFIFMAMRENECYRFLTVAQGLSLLEMLVTPENVNKPHPIRNVHPLFVQHGVTQLSLLLYAAGFRLPQAVIDFLSSRGADRNFDMGAGISVQGFFQMTHAMQTLYQIHSSQPEGNLDEEME